MKLPGIKDLKRMGNDLAQSAKANQIIDKLKNSVDSLATGVSDHADYQETGDALVDSLSACQHTLSELKEVNKIQANLFNNLDKALSKLSLALTQDEQNSSKPTVDADLEK